MACSWDSSPPLLGRYAIGYVYLPPPCGSFLLLSICILPPASGWADSAYCALHHTLLPAVPSCFPGLVSKCEATHCPLSFVPSLMHVKTVGETISTAAVLDWAVCAIGGNYYTIHYWLPSSRSLCRPHPASGSFTWQLPSSEPMQLLEGSELWPSLSAQQSCHICSFVFPWLFILLRSALPALLLACMLKLLYQTVQFVSVLQELNIIFPALAVQSSGVLGCL